MVSKGVPAAHWRAGIGGRGVGEVLAGTERVAGAAHVPVELGVVGKLGADAHAGSGEEDLEELDSIARKVELGAV